MTTDLSARLACFKLSMMMACVSGHLHNASNLHQPPSRQSWCYHHHHLHQVHDHWSTTWALTINIIYMGILFENNDSHIYWWFSLELFHVPQDDDQWPPIETEAKHVSSLSVDLNKYRSLGAAVSLLMVIISLIVMISVLVVMMIATPPISYIWQQTQENNDFENKMVTF